MRGDAAGGWTRTSDTLILHGRRICKPRPLCDRCAVRRDCIFYTTVTRSASIASAQAVEAREGLTREQFTRLVEEALREIPRRFRDAMKNVAVVVEEEPPPALLAEMEVGPDDPLFGLYQGIPLPQRGWGYGNALPDRISIYQFPIEDACEDDDEISDCIAETVIHEFGHYFGMSEEEIEEIEEKYWRGEAPG